MSGLTLCRIYELKQFGPYIWVRFVYDSGPTSVIKNPLCLLQFPV